MRLMTFNMNGIRSCERKGFFPWFLEQNVDILCVQETKAQLSKLDRTPFHLPGYELYFVDALKPGYSGVAIYTRIKPDLVETMYGEDLYDDEGRYICCQFGSLKVVSLYLPSGTSGDVRQEVKYQAMDSLMASLLKPAIVDKTSMIVAGDWNIAHQNIDLKNWRNNQKNSGFLPQEREWLTEVLEQGWVDTLRYCMPEQEIYTWWSFRGAARRNNVGWRIDYQMCTPSLASSILHCQVHPDPLFSDHAPMVVDYDQRILG